MVNDGHLDPIPKHLPPKVRELFVAKQLLELRYPDIPDEDGRAMTKAVSFAELPEEDFDDVIPDPGGVVWIWSDWPIAHFRRTLGRRDDGVALLADLESGQAVEVYLGGPDVLPNLIFPTSDPEMLAEAQPHTRRHVVLNIPADQLRGQHISTTRPPMT